MPQPKMQKRTTRKVARKIETRPILCCGNDGAAGDIVLFVCVIGDGGLLVQKLT